MNNTKYVLNIRVRDIMGTCLAILLLGGAIGYGLGAQRAAALAEEANEASIDATAKLAEAKAWAQIRCASR
jgi:hypothetical protein